MLIARRILLPFLALAAVLMIARIHRTSTDAQALKLDLAELDDLRYGLLDIDVWVGHVSGAMRREIEELGDAPLPREEIQAVFEDVIRQLITEVEETFLHRNEEGLVGQLRQMAASFVVDFDELRANSGEYASIAVDELERPENRARLESFLTERLAAFADSTFDQTDRRGFDAVLARRSCADAATCRTRLTAELDERNGTLMRSAFLAIGLVALAILVAAWPARRFRGLELACLLVGVFALLFGGLFTPMIDIKAEITRIDLVLVGQPITFQNQVLFFQSKSITDVVDLLVRTGRLDLVLVGIAIGTFSIVFPIFKLLATLAYRYGPRLRERAPVRFFALESGKWSMADVFVVAMFLAYLGFDGLTGSQLAVLLSDSPVDLATRNGTALRAGFHLFAAFCIAGMVLSALVKRATVDQLGVSAAGRPAEPESSDI